MDDQEVAKELIELGIIDSDDLSSAASLGRLLVKEGLIGADELNQGKTVFEILRDRGIL